MIPFQKGDRITLKIEYNLSNKREICIVRNCELYFHGIYALAIEGKPYTTYDSSYFEKVNDRKDRIDNLNL